jgi:hypothetical protein
MENGGDLESPVEAVEGAAEIEVLESFLSEESETEDPHRDGSVPPFLVGFVDFESFLEFDAILHNRSRSA